jgi:hypothetical protein
MDSSKMPDESSVNAIFCLGYWYRLNSRQGDSLYYVCRACKSTKCKARLVRRAGQITLSRELHTCQSTQLLINDQSAESFIDNAIRMAADLSLNPSEIYRRLVVEASLTRSDTAVEIPSKCRVFAAIRGQRQAGCRTDLSELKNLLHRCIGNQEFWRCSWQGMIAREEHQIVLWMSPEAIALLRANHHVFIDGTFRCVPLPFEQLIIVMTFDPSTSCFVPCAYALLSGKSELLYLRMFHEIIFHLNYMWSPTHITCDFEAALIKAVRHEFPESELHGCLFHWKQALARKLVTRELSNEEANEVLQKISFLTALPPNEILAAVEYAKAKLADDARLTPFWHYFVQTWCMKFPPTLWTYSSMSQSIRNRTNNPLERYNRRLNERFPCRHPNIFAFLDVIKDEARYYSLLLNNIRAGVEPFPNDPEFTVPQIPSDFIITHHVTVKVTRSQNSLLK